MIIMRGGAALLAFPLLVQIALSVPAPGIGDATRFEAWVERHNRVYRSDAERSHRKAAYHASLERYRLRNEQEGPHGAHYGPDADADRTPQELAARSLSTRLSGSSTGGTDPVFSAAELHAAGFSDVSIDWRTRGAVTPVQQQHPFGTCWAMSLVAMAEGVNVVQGGNPLVKLSEQQVVSCIPENKIGSMADTTVPWLASFTSGSLQLEQTFPYNRTCNSVRETLLAPDGTRDGYKGSCNDSVPLLHGRCTPCGPEDRVPDGAPPCKTNPSVGPFSTARLQDYGFVSVGDPPDDRRMVAALVKYGPLQLAINTGCVHGYKKGIIVNCTTDLPQGHAVTIVGAGTGPAPASIPYWVVKNSWNTTFGEEGYFRVARSPPQLNINGAYFGCYNKGCA